MSSKNVETVRAAHESWNRRDFDGVVSSMSDNFTYTDHARNLHFKSRDEFKAWTKEWAKSMSDGRIVKPSYIDAGDTVIAQFTAEGTNDGALGPLPATGKRMSFDFCEVVHFDKNGKVVSGGCYYNEMTILSQLGHAKPLSAAA
jgi:steroid delta-isomerase-like uncharacterized protein